MGEVRQLFKASDREQRTKMRAINPEVPPHAAFGDVGYVVPEMEHLDQDMMAWWLVRLVKIGLGIVAAFAALGLLLILAAWWFGVIAAAPLILIHDDGRYANAPLKSWFDQLASAKGLCCSFADGVTIEDVDWDTGGPNGSYRVRLSGKWVDVPDASLIKQPNKFGPAVVWPYKDADGVTQIRCFLPGAGT